MKENFSLPLDQYAAEYDLDNIISLGEPLYKIAIFLI